MSVPAKPLPVPDERSAPFWQAAAEGRLVAQRCVHCGHLAYPPRGLCAGCRDLDAHFDWVDVGERGRVSTWTVVRDALLPGFAEELPYVVADVEIDGHDGLRVLARVVGIDPETMRIGLPVAVGFDTVADGIGVAYFRPVEAG